MLITAVIAFLFLVVAGLLAFGFRSFGRKPSGTANEPAADPQVNMRLEVLWTALAAALLLGVFVLVR